MRPLPPRAILAIVLSVSAAALGGCVLKAFDPDTFHHLAMGRHVATAGLVSGEPFLFPMRGAPIGPVPYWLGSLAIYGWHLLTGDGGLPFLPAAVGALLAAVLLLDASPRGSRHTAVSLAAAALPLLLAVLGFRYRAAARPELFATLFLALVLLAVRRFEDGAPRLLYAFPVIALLWANVHPSVLSGVVVVGALTATDTLRAAVARLRHREPPEPHLGRRAALSGGLAMAGLGLALLNPSPENPVSVALRFIASTLSRGPVAPGASADGEVVLRSIREMRPLGAHFFVEPFGILLVLTALVMLLRWRAVRLREVATVALFTALAVSAARFAVLLAVVCAPIAARHLGALLAAAPEHLGRWRARAMGAAACVLAAVAATPLAAAEPMLCPGTGLRPGAYPIRAVDYLEAIGFEGRLFNTMQFGGYLSWRGVGPPYQDGRGVLLPGEAHAAMIGPLDRWAFRPLDEKYRFDALLLAYPDEKPASSALFHSRYGDGDWTADRSSWSLVAFDDGGLLYLRRDGRYAARAAADEYRNAMPANTVFAPRQHQVLPLLAEFRRSVAESPGCVLCRYYHAVAALSLGRAEEARETLDAIPDAGCVVHVLPVDAAREETERALRSER